MRFPDVVKKLYEFKLRAFLGIFSSMIAIQLIGIIFSLGGVFNIGTGTSSGITINISYYSADMVVILTMVWVFVTGIMITTKSARHHDFVFVANRLSSSAANILFLITASAIGGVTSVFSGFLLKTIAYFLGDVQYGTGNSLFEAPEQFMISIAAAVSYMVLFSSAGYLAGMLVQWRKILIFVLPVVTIGLITYLSIRDEELAQSWFNVIFGEPSLFLFLMKILTISTLCFAGAALLSNRMEVKN
jgi:hypothetical protein